MPEIRTDLVDGQSAALDVLRAVPAEVSDYRAASDDELIELSGILTEQQRIVDVNRSLVAGEISRRSAPELGSRGLAQQRGHRNPEELLRALSGSTLRDVKTTIQVGTVAHDLAELPDARTGEVAGSATPWLAPVGVALAEHQLGVEQAKSISKGIGVPGAGIDADGLEAAVAQLCDEAATLDADRLADRARQLREELDAAGTAEREQKRYEKRGVRVVKLADGMTRLIWDSEGETAALVTDLYDRCTSPKRGGPRFIDADEVAAAARVEADPRTPAQLASDVFADLLRQGADADSSHLLGHGAAVQILVTATALTDQNGRGWIQGQPDPISLASVERAICSDGAQPIVFDEHGRPLDVGRESRLFTRKQRRALEARDGGCRICGAPVSWTESHHIKHWLRDRGRTDIDLGILLCRFDHLRVHREGWEIVGEGGEFWLIPPPSKDPTRTRILLASKSDAYRELQRGLERVRERKAG